MQFFFIREEVMPIAMIFRPSAEIEKEDTPISMFEMHLSSLLTWLSCKLGVFIFMTNQNHQLN
ncbi:hypothetical protein Hanom_Chr06g00538251 [Helianthus anomalus]